MQISFQMFCFKATRFALAEPSNSSRTTWEMTSHAGQYIKSGVELRRVQFTITTSNSLSKRKNVS